MVSTLSTPSDDHNFAVTQSEKITEDDSLIAAYLEMSQDSESFTAIAPSPTQSTLSPTVVVTPNESQEEKAPTSADVSLADGADQSLALDTAEAVIVSDPPRVVSPTVTRAKLIPAPQSPAPAPASPSSPFAEPPTTPKSMPKSFHATVHGRVASNITPQHTGSHQHHVVSLPAEPVSPGFGDLADLLADAAMLELQLSGSPSPLKQSVSASAPAPAPAPAPVRVSVPAPAPAPAPVRPVVQTVVKPAPAPAPPSPAQDSVIAYLQPSSSEEHSPETSLSFHTAESDLDLSLQPQIVTVPVHHTVRRLADASPEPPTPPPKSPPRARPLSSILGRRMSSNSRREKGLPAMPGAFPRNSVCSEMSSEDSVLVSTPPSVVYYEPSDTDASSVRSSTRSWKMPKKGSISRATSFADRLWNKRESKQPRIVSSGEYLDKTSCK